MSSNDKKDKSWPKLENAAQFPKWNLLLQDRMFKLFKNNDMTKIKQADTLDPAYMKKQFPSEYKAAGKDADDNDQPPLQDEDFAEQCFTHAVSSGAGFRVWVYDLFPDIRSRLSDRIQEQTAGVPTGDLVGLLAAIRLSVQHFETFDSDQLEIQFMTCTMAEHAGNDLMTYTSKLKNYIHRLTAAGVHLAEGKKMRVLLNGLDQDIFEAFIAATNRHPYASLGLVYSRH